MKKLYLSMAFAAISVASMAQVQRMVLAEGHSNASCPPCASQNPGYNALLEANTSKVIAIKYQANFPGYDPMNQENPTEALARRNYYSVNGVPHGMVDGISIANDCNAYVGALACLSQTDINTAYAVPSPFSVDVTHTINGAEDSVFIQVIIRAEVQITSQTDLKAHVLMTEKLITYASAPGSNGEKEFHHVMRKMYPNASGTNLAADWNPGDEDTLTFAVAIPSYIRDKSEIEIVAFVQRNTSKVVHQAGISHAVPLANRGSNLGLVAGDIYSCVNSINPTLSLYNKGNNDITSCVINYKLDNGTLQSFNWSGNVAPGDTGTFAIPAINGIAPGSHTLTAYCSDLNGTTNDGGLQLVKSFIIASANIGAAPVVESFASIGLPADWTAYTYGTPGIWARVSASAYGNGVGSVRCNLYEIPQGEKDLYTKRYDLTSMIIPQMKFSVAYAPYNNQYVDRLKVLVSTDCGQNWDEVYAKQTGTLNTAPATTSAFTPSATQWRDELIDMTPYAGETDVLVLFKAISGYGNNVYVDDINIGISTVGIESNDVNLGVFPNPAVDYANVNFYFPESAETDLYVINMLGEVVMAKNLGKVSGNQMINLNTSNLAAGTYSIKLVAGQQTFHERFVVVR